MNKKLRRLLGRGKKSSDIETKNKRNKKALSSLLCERNNAEPNQYLSGQRVNEDIKEDDKDKLGAFVSVDSDLKDDLDIPENDKINKNPELNSEVSAWSELIVNLTVENDQNVNKIPCRTLRQEPGAAASVNETNTHEILLYNERPKAKFSTGIIAQPNGIWPVTQHIPSTASDSFKPESFQQKTRQVKNLQSNEFSSKGLNIYTNQETTNTFAVEKEMNEGRPIRLSISESENSEVNSNKLTEVRSSESKTNEIGCQKRRQQHHLRHCASSHHHGYCKNHQSSCHSCHRHRTANRSNKILRCSSPDYQNEQSSNFAARTTENLETKCCCLKRDRHTCTMCTCRRHTVGAASKRYSSAVLFTITDDNVAQSKPRVLEFPSTLPHFTPTPSLHPFLHGVTEDPEAHASRACKRHLNDVTVDDVIDNCQKDICHCCHSNAQFSKQSLPLQRTSENANIRSFDHSVSGFNQSEDSIMPPALSLDRPLLMNNKNDRQCHHTSCWCSDKLKNKPDFTSSGFFSDSCTYNYEDTFCRTPSNVQPVVQQSLAHFSLSKRAYARLISYCHTKKLLTNVYPDPASDSNFDPFLSMQNDPLQRNITPKRHPTYPHHERRRVRTEDSSALELCRLGKVFETVEECPWYWGPLSGQEAKKKLRGTPPGTFLLRDSSDSRFLFSLSLKTEQGPTSIRIVYQDGLFRFDSEHDDVTSSRSRHPKTSSKTNDKRRQCVIRMILHYTSHLSIKLLQNLTIDDLRFPSATNGGSTNVSSTASGSSGAHSQFMCFWVDQGGRKEIPVALSHPLTTGCKTLKQMSRSRISKHYRLWESPSLITTLALPELLKQSLRKYPYPV